MRKITVTDRTLAEKCKSAGTTLSFKEKVEIARLLEAANVDAVEFPAIENEKTDTLLLKTVCAFLKNSILSVTVGLTEDGIEKAWAAVSSAKKPRLTVALPVSPVQMEYVCHKKAPKMLDYIKTLVAKACALCTDVEFMALDATRAESDFLKSAIETAVAAGAKTVTVCDNEASMLPDKFSKFVKEVKAYTGENISLGIMCEDKISMAAASSMLGIGAGADEIKVACGKCPIASFKTVGDIIRNNGDKLGIFTSVNYTEFARIESQIAKIADSTRSETSVFDTTAAPVSNAIEINLTENDSIATVTAAVKKLGYDLSEEDNAKVYESFKKLAEKKPVSDKELDAIVASSALQVPPAYKLISYVINTGNIITSSSQIALEKDGEQKQAICVGDGPIDASFLTIEQIIGHHYELDDFQIQAVTEGREAMGSAVVKLRSGGKLYSGNGISTDILGASINAYINALNKIIFEEN